MLDALRQAAIFEEIPPKGLVELAREGRHRVFAPGDALMRQGEHADCLHIILSGRVRVERTHPDLLDAVVLTELEAGEVVGEMGVLDGEPRSATVTAIEATETLELSA